jgi:hypothetical protein
MTHHERRTSARRALISGLLAGSVALFAAGAGVAGASSAAPALTVSPQPPGPVPPQYAGEYATVEHEVQAFAALSGAPAANASTTIGTELLSANGNIGTGLLRPGAIDGVVNELDAFEALGVTGVTVDVSFPLLLPSTPDSAGYLAFYEQVATQVHQRHLVLSVEENPVFVGTPLTTLRISYSGLTLASYAAEQRAQARTIIDHLHPRYLSLLTEPDTFADALGLPLDTAANAEAAVRAELAGLHRATTLVGAGAGTWSSPTIDAALLRGTSIDYLDVHVYPIGASDVANLQTDVAAAKRAGKTLVMDETWLAKPTATEGTGPAGAPEELKVKSYSFWEPLDTAFVTEMANYVRADGFAYVSFFDGARAFFGYLTWSPALEATSYQQFSAEYNQLVATDMASRTITDPGEALVQAIAST